MDRAPGLAFESVKRGIKHAREDIGAQHPDVRRLRAGCPGQDNGADKRASEPTPPACSAPEGRGGELFFAADLPCEPKVSHQTALELPAGRLNTRLAHALTNS